MMQEIGHVGEAENGGTELQITRGEWGGAGRLGIRGVIPSTPTLHE